MNEEQMRYVLPRRLDDPMKFLLWDFDVVMIFFGVVLLGITAGAMMTGALVGFVLAYFFSKAKSGRSRGYAMHLAYWYLPIAMFKRTPQSARREFTG